MHNLFKAKKIYVPHWKNTVNSQTEEIPIRTHIHLMLSQNIGTPCEPVVSVGDMVYVGQIVAKSSALVSVPIHASTSGVVESVDTQKIVIKSDGKQTIDPSIKPPVVRCKEDFIEVVKQSGLVGLGGAGFPTYAKLNVKDRGRTDTLIVNAAECEPFVTSDTREIIENAVDVLDGICVLQKCLAVTSVMIGIEVHNKEAISILRSMISKNSVYENIQVIALPAKYPQGAEKILIESCTQRVVPLGKLPGDIGVIVLNVSSVGFLGRYFKTGMPLITRRLTVDGDAIKTPKNVCAPIGTLVKDLVEFCDGYQLPPAKILLGGPMMGTPLASDEVPITKRSNAVTIFSQKQAAQHKEIACIRCARCADACPVSIMPVLIDQNVRLKNMQGLRTLSVNACIDCGLCSFVCPSNRTLIQNVRVGKELLYELREGGHA